MAWVPVASGSCGPGMRGRPHVQRAVPSRARRPWPACAPIDSAVPYGRTPATHLRPTTLHPSSASISVADGSSETTRSPSPCVGASAKVAIAPAVEV